MGLADEVAAITGSRIQRTDPLRGGSLSSVVRLTLQDGRRMVAKRAAGVAREARMLRHMAQAGVPVPNVLGQQDDLLLMEDVGAGPALSHDAGAGWAALADALQPLHAETSNRYGWPEDHAFGAVQIVNRMNSSWPEFWAMHRLIGPAAGLHVALRTRLDRLAAGLRDLLPTEPPSALLHGDLWGGNVLLPSPGRAVLIDPACYYGDRRVDLAMLCFFDDPPAAFLETSGIADPDWPQICSIYQLWPALVHLRLFGRRYLTSVEQRLDRLGV